MAELCSGPWYSRAWAWGHEAAIYVGFFILFPVWIVSGGPLARVQALAPKAPTDPNLPKIVCAKCGKPVDSVEVNRNMMTCCVVYSIKCHGQYEHINVEDEMVDAADRVEMVDYIAFQQKPELPPHG